MKHERLLRLPAVCEQTGLRRSSLYRAISRGELDPGIPISPRCVAWPQTVVDEFVNKKISAATARADGQPTEKSKP